VVEQLDLHLKAGEIGCLLGPSGCGKTTTLRAIAGFEALLEGEISLGGEVISRPGFTLAPEKRRIGMVFQDYALFPHLTVLQNVAFGIRRQENWERITAELLELVNLGQPRQALPARTFRRPATARSPGASAGTGTATAAAGRTVLQPGWRVAPAPEPRGPRYSQGPWHQRHSGHP
jgi:ABC-type glutathione transport system ATPase component